MSQGPIGLQAIWNIKHAEPFKATAAELSELVQRNEPGAILYHFFLSEDQKTATFHEWYADSASALRHVTGPAATEFMPRFLENGDVKAFHVYGNVDAPLREALEALGPPIDPHLGGFHRVAPQSGQ